MANEERADRITTLTRIERALRKLPHEDRVAVLSCLIDLIDAKDRAALLAKKGGA